MLWYGGVGRAPLRRASASTGRQYSWLVLFVCFVIVFSVVVFSSHAARTPYVSKHHLAMVSKNRYILFAMLVCCLCGLFVVIVCSFVLIRGPRLRRVDSTGRCRTYLRCSYLSMCFFGIAEAKASQKNKDILFDTCLDIPFAVLRTDYGRFRTYYFRT